MNCEEILSNKTLTKELFKAMENFDYNIHRIYYQKYTYEYIPDPTGGCQVYKSDYAEGISKSVYINKDTLYNLKFKLKLEEVLK